MKWLVQDQLGSTRMEIGIDGAANAVTRHDYLPFGEELGGTMRSTANGYTLDNTKQKFTGTERDSETTLDFMQARYCSSVQGRFAGVDPLISSARPSRPQTWNRYSYVINNPLKYTDTSGLDWYSHKINGKLEYIWFEGKGKHKGYSHVNIGKDGLKINNVTGATGQFKGYNGHNITLSNVASKAIVDNGRYLPPAKRPINPWADSAESKAIVGAWGISVAIGAALPYVAPGLVDAALGSGDRSYSQ